MKICFIGPANSSHIVKWCTWFSEHGHGVHLISFTPGEIQGTIVHVVDIHVDPNGSDFVKLKYLMTGRKIRKLVENIKPDIVNVHYATSYGIAIALSGISNYVLSVWGSDIYDFPKKSIFHKALLKYSLWRAKYLFSTSKAMAKEAAKYTGKKFEITPFGVDMNLFNPNKRTRNKKDGVLVVGTIKALVPKYGIDYLIKAIAEIAKLRPDIKIHLRIAGNGKNVDDYIALAKEEGIDNITTWLGFISQEDCAKEWADMDIAVVISTLESESFGVSAIEAEACSVPVIVSDIPGLMETTLPGITSIVVKRMNIEETRDAIIKLCDNAQLREKIGQEGRKYVISKYEMNLCFEHIKKIFEEYVYI